MADVPLQLLSVLPESVDGRSDTPCVKGEAIRYGIGDVDIVGIPGAIRRMLDGQGVVDAVGGGHNALVCIFCYGEIGFFYRNVGRVIVYKVVADNVVVGENDLVFDDVAVLVVKCIVDHGGYVDGEAAGAGYVADKPGELGVTGDI